MINRLLAACNNRFHAERHGHVCNDCTYEGYCPNDDSECERCLELVHFPARVPDGTPPRRYDCTHMADYYVCKYACRYVSELVYGFERLRDLFNRRHLNVLSFGCGPCTDLLALDYLRQSEIYNFGTLEYRGVDYSEEVWSNIHDNLQEEASDGINIAFYYEDARELMAQIATSNWLPDLVVFQYFFSDMNKNATPNEITAFINYFAEYANNRIQPNSYIILNDINLSIKYQGGREYFDRLNGLLHNYEYHKTHFNNDRPGHGTYLYGNGSDGENPDNNLRFPIVGLDVYSPFTHCASAQMLLKKRS